MYYFTNILYINTVIFYLFDLTQGKVKNICGVNNRFHHIWELLTFTKRNHLQVFNQ